MKKLLVLFVFSISVLGLDAQIKGGVTWFDAGVKVQYGGAALYNTAIVNSTEYNYDLGLTTGLGVGARLGFNYDNNGVILEFMLNQGAQPLEKQSDNTTLDVNWSTYDLNILYRNSANKAYFEIGPKYSIVNKAELSANNEIIDMKADFQNYISGVVGFGAYLLGNDGAFQGLLGLRAEYGFTDAVTADAKSLGTPIRDAALYSGDDTNAATNLIFAGLVFELNWGIGYYAKAGCGSRSKFIRF